MSLNQKNKQEIYKKHINNILIYENYRDITDIFKENLLNYDKIQKIEKSDYVDSIYFIGLYYLYDLHKDQISTKDSNEYIKKKFFDKYMELFKKLRILLKIHKNYKLIYNVFNMIIYYKIQRV